MRTPRRGAALAVGDGSLNGKAVAPKAMRWWFEDVCAPAAWTRGDIVARGSVWFVVVGGRGCLRRSFWIGLVVRRLDVRMRLRFWRVWTWFGLALEFGICIRGFRLGCLLSARIEVISVSSSTSSGSGDVGARDVVVVILGCWFVDPDTMLKAGMGISQCYIVIESKVCCSCTMEDWGCWSCLFATRDHVNI
jgi:hypothetical protein